MSILAISSEVGSIEIFETQSFTCINKIEQKDKEKIECLCFSNDNSKIAFYYKNIIKIYNVVTSELLNQIENDINLVAISFNYDSTLLFSTCEQCIFKIWDINTSICLNSFTFDDYRINTNRIKFSLDKTKFIYVHGDGSVKVWDINTNSMIINLGPDCTCTCAISHDNNLIITGSIDKKVRILNMNGVCLHKFKHDNTIFSVSFNHDSTLAISDSRVLFKVWNVETGLCLYEVFKYITYISFNNDDSNLIVSVSKTYKGEKLTFWDIKEKLPLAKIKLDRCEVTSLTFSCKEFGSYI